MKTFYCFFLVFFFCCEIIESAPKAVSVLLVTKRARPEIGPTSYLILGRSRHTKQWGPFMTRLHGDEHTDAAAVRALVDSVAAPDTMCMTEQELHELVDTESPNMWYRIDNQMTGIFTYIIFLRPHRGRRFKVLFNRYIEDACNEPLHVDRMALLRWDNIEMALRKKTNRVYAHIVKRGERRLHEEYRLITLSNAFLASIEPFFLRKSYEKSKDPKVRIYR